VVVEAEMVTEEAEEVKIVEEVHVVSGKIEKLKEDTIKKKEKGC
jgi:hypothetical protein